LPTPKRQQDWSFAVTVPPYSVMTFVVPLG
jgi:hypothetical protein